MSIMKKAKPKRLLSLLLTVVMLLGVLPLSAVPVSAEGNDPGWTTISGANDISRMAQLEGYLSRSGTKYIKLGEDIELNGNEGNFFPINGEKHLDLNGHRINYSDGRAVSADFMFEVKSGAKMYIYDSSAKQTGYIHFDGRLTKDTNSINRHLFLVDPGAKLVVNGGELEAGRSKEIYVANYFGYCGYVRQQVTGTAIYVSKGAECVINGGTIRGRGSASGVDRIYLKENGMTTRSIDVYNAAINNAGTLIVNDGFIKGMGGANAIKEPDDEKNREDLPTTTIYSSVLDTHKVDRIYAGAGTGYHSKWEWGHYGNSDTGVEIAHRTVDYVGGKYDETDDSRRTWNIYGTSSKTAGEFFKIQSKTAVGGVASALPSSWNPTQNYWVGVDIGTRSAAGEYAPYYTYDAAKALDRDYNSNTGYQSMLTWAVYDSNGKRVSAEINKVPTMADNYNHLSKASSENLRVNMKDFTAPGGGAISWTTGQQYTLRCTITESWQGQNAWNITSFDEWNFAITNWLAVVPTLTAEQAPTYTGETADIIATANSNGNLSKLYDQVWHYGYYGMVDGTYQPIWQAQNRDSSVYTYTALPAGSQRLCMMIYGQTVDGLYQSLNATTDVLVMPRIRALIKGDAYYYRYTTWTNDKIWHRGSNPCARMKAIDTNLLKDPVSGTPLTYNGRTIDGNSICWQWWNSTTQTWVDIYRTGDTGSTNVTGVNLTQDTDGSYCILETDRTGTYRAYISCYGKRWYSAAPIQFDGKDYSAANAYKVSASVSETTTEYNDGNKIKFTVNSNDAEWGTWSAGLIIRKDGVPEGAWKYFDGTGATEKQTSYFSRNNTTGVSREVNLYAPSTIYAFSRMNSADDIIPGKYTFIPVAKAQNGTVVKGEPFSITVEKMATGADILANQLNVTNGEGSDTIGAPTYVLPANTNTVTFRPQKVQANATLPDSADVTVGWSSSDPRVATIDYETGVFTAKQPGTTRITMTYVYVQNGSRVQYNRYLNVVVPIAEFKFGEVDWATAAKNGIKYQTLTLPITQVRSYQGEWINNTTAKYMEAKCTQTAYLATGEPFGTNKTVEYNQSVRVQFKAVAKEGYQLYLKPTDTGSYVADTGNIKTHAVGSTAMDTALKLGYNFSSGYGGEYRKNGTSGYDSPSLCGVIIPMEQPCIKNPNARYVDVVSVTTAEPREGDSRYQGNPDAYLVPGGDANMMAVEVLTLMNDGAPIKVKGSRVNKVSSVQGSGIAYDPVSYADYIANMSEATNVLGTTQKPADAAALTALRYEAATYFHNLILTAGSTDSEGKTVYFAPDVKLFINGHPVELILNGYNGSVDSGYDAQRLEVRYYYVSDASPAFTGGTVSGLTAPATGATPVSAEDLTVSAVRADNTKSSDALYVSRLTWYVDADGNGKLDDGEDTDVLAADGTFKGDTVYSAYMELAANENMGRIDNLSFALKLNTGAANPVILNSTAANGSYTFAKTDPPPGVTVSGTATSFGSGADDVTVQLIASGTSEAAYEAVVQGNSIGYAIENVVPGTYTMKVMKQNHVTREYTVTVGTENLKQDVEIWLLGDVTGDGNVNIKDWGRMRSHINGTSLLDGYAFACADVTQDGNVNIKDWGRMRSHINGTNPLW